MRCFQCSKELDKGEGYGSYRGAWGDAAQYVEDSRRYCYRCEGKRYESGRGEDMHSRYGHARQGGKVGKHMDPGSYYGHEG